MLIKNKIKTKDEIVKISEELKKQGKIIVTTNGCFDILHCAHINYFEKSKDYGDILIVMLNSDDSVIMLKGEKRPLVPQEQRAKIIASLESVDYVVVFDEINPLDLMKEIKPNKHLKSGEIIKERIKVEKELVESWGGEYIHLESEEGYSTTGIIKKILEVYGQESDNFQECL